MKQYILKDINEAALTAAIVCYYSDGTGVEYVFHIAHDDVDILENSTSEDLRWFVNYNEPAKVIDL